MGGEAASRLLFAGGDAGGGHAGWVRKIAQSSPADPEHADLHLG